jgi:ComF family protein
MKMEWGRVFELLGLKGKSTSRFERDSSTDGLKSIRLSGEFDSGYALDEYRESPDSNNDRTPVGELVYRFKYRYDMNSGLELARLLERLIRQNEEFNRADLILTVPPSFISRLFDPISFLAEEVSRKTKVPYQKDIIKRVRLTGLQKRILDKRSKMENVRGAFELRDKDKMKGKKILVMDDIYASGATINEVTRVLKEGGTEDVFALRLIKTSWGRGWRQKGIQMVT